MTPKRAAEALAWTTSSRTSRRASSISLRNSIETPNSSHLPDYEQINLSIVQKVDTGIFNGMELRLDVLAVELS